MRVSGEGGQTVIVHGFLPAPVIPRFGFHPRPQVVHVPSSSCAPSLPTTTTTSTPTTSTTAPTGASTTTTTTTAAPTTAPAGRAPAPLPECTPDAPDACDDGDPCTADRCTDGSCTHGAVGDFDQVGCRLEAMRTLVNVADGGSRSRARLGRRLARVSRLVGTAEEASGRRAVRNLRRAAQALRGFLRAVERSRGLEPALLRDVVRTADEVLQRLPALERQATSARGRARRPPRIF